MLTPALATLSGEPPGPDADVEAAVLSSVMLEGTALDTCLTRGLRTADFHVEAHRLVYEAAVHLHASILRPASSASLDDNVAAVLARSR